MLKKGIRVHSVSKLSEAMVGNNCQQLGQISYDCKGFINLAQKSEQSLVFPDYKVIEPMEELIRFTIYEPEQVPIHILQKCTYRIYTA